MSAIAAIRDALSQCGTALTRAELLDTTNLDAGALDKNLYAAKKRGELLASVEDGKPTYALNPAYVRPAIGRRSPPATPAAVAPVTPVADGAAAPTTALTAPPLSRAPAATTTDLPVGTRTAATRMEVFAGNLRTACALADQSVEDAVRLPAPPAIVLQLVQASRQLHGAALAVIGGEA